MSILNKILQWIIDRLNGIGTVYTGTKLVTSVPSNSYADVLSVTVPPGTYVITANVEWGISTGATTIISLYADSTCLALCRGNMSAGGGDACSAIITVETNTKLRVMSYQSHSSAASLGFISLRAIKIK